MFDGEKERGFYNFKEDLELKKDVGNAHPAEKQEAEEILRHRLFFHGNNGELEDGSLEASFEEGETFNAIYDDAFEFVKSKYPWLSENDG